MILLYMYIVYSMGANIPTTEILSIQDMIIHWYHLTVYCIKICLKILSFFLLEISIIHAVNKKKKYTWQRDYVSGFWCKVVIVSLLNQLSENYVNLQNIICYEFMVLQVSKRFQRNDKKVRQLIYWNLKCTIFNSVYTLFARVRNL